MRKLALLSIALGAVMLLSGCVYNMPSTEKIKVVAESGSQYAIRIENHGDTAVPPDGRVELAVPSLPRGCSVYLFGLIKIRESSPEYLPAIHVLRDGKVVRKLSLHKLHKPCRIKTVTAWLRYDG
jgi:hypothetical protein